MAYSNGRVHKLDSLTISQISAGEVIENPAAAVKELIENSIDAGADYIKIIIERSGYGKIMVLDNGSGILKKDLSLVLESFTTSKLRQIHDLSQIGTLGFRGEALGAIRSVSETTIESKHSQEEYGWEITAKGDFIGEISPSQIHEGTRITIENLFFNVPVRKEFANDEKKVRKEITEMITWIALSYPEIFFELIMEGETLFSLTKEKYRSERIRQLYGDVFIDNLLPVYHEEKSKELLNTTLKIEGFISSFDFYRSSPSILKLFVNRRLIQYKKLTGLFRNVYGEMLPSNKFPIGFLFLEINPNLVDVNIHPQKKEVYFRDEMIIHSFLKRGIASVINSPYPIRGKMMKRSNSRSEHKDESSLSDSLHQENLDFQTIPVFDIKSSKNQDSSSDFLSNQKPNVVSQDSYIPSSSSFQLPREIHTRIFNTFILGTSEEGIFLIDQHTIHERINYEKFKKKLKENENVSQRLLHSLPLNLSPAEKHTLSDYENLLKKIGFDWEDFGPVGMALNAAPHYISSNEEENAFFKALHLVQKGSLSAEELFDSLAKDLSCKSSITAGYDNSLENIKLLLDELKKCDEPHRCPHGRPTIIFLGKDDIHHLFKRVDHRFK